MDYNERTLNNALSELFFMQIDVEMAERDGRADDLAIYKERRQQQRDYISALHAEMAQDDLPF